MEAIIQNCNFGKDQEVYLFSPGSNDRIWLYSLKSIACKTVSVFHKTGKHVDSCKKRPKTEPKQRTYSSAH